MKQALGTKLYYSIGEVAELTQLAPYTLRSWEREFPCLRPRRIRGKNRAYRQRDIGIILLIRRLLHEDRYSTRGARQKLRNEPELVRGAVESVAGLTGDDPPSNEELAAAGLTNGSAAAPRSAPSSPAAADGRSAPDRELLRQLRAELQEVLDLLR